MANPTGSVDQRYPSRLIGATTRYGLLLWAAVVVQVVIVSELLRALSDKWGVDPIFPEAALALALAALIVPVDRYLRPRLDRLFFKERVALRAGIAPLLEELSLCDTHAALFARVGERLNAMLLPESCVVYGRCGDQYEPRLIRSAIPPPLFSAQGALSAVLREHPIRVARYGPAPGTPDRAALDSIGVAVVVPIRNLTVLSGFICIGRKGSGDRYTSTDLALLATVADKLSSELTRCAAPSSAHDSFRGAGIATEDRACASTQPSVSRSPGPTGVFRKEGDFWTIAHEGTTFRLKDAKGLSYLSYLLHQPGREIHALDLMMQTQRNGTTRSSIDCEAVLGMRASEDGPLLDAQSKATYKRRLDELRDGLIEAERNNDIGRAPRIRTEMEFITGQLAAAVGIGGRDRPVASSAERARLTVTKGIKAALAKIHASDPSLGRHLASSVKTGYFCSYTPDPKRLTAWQ